MQKNRPALAKREPQGRGTFFRMKALHNSSICFPCTEFCMYGKLKKVAPMSPGVAINVCNVGGCIHSAVREQEEICSQI